MRRLLALALAGALASALAATAGAPLRAQVPDATRIPAARPQADTRAAPAQQTAPARDTARATPHRPREEGARRISPAGAALRSMIVPGWGHAAVGAYTRGAFYVLADAAAAWMLFKTSVFLDRARSLEGRRVEDVRRRLAEQGITDPDSILAAIDADPAVEDARALVDSRQGQLEDWVALGAFLFLLGGADAFISAHLADFPAPVAVAPGAGGRVELRLSVPVRLPGESATAPAGARRPGR